MRDKLRQAENRSLDPYERIARYEEVVEELERQRAFLMGDIDHAIERLIFEEAEDLWELLERLSDEITQQRLAMTMAREMSQQQLVKDFLDLALGRAFRIQRVGTTSEDIRRLFPGIVEWLE